MKFKPKKKMIEHALDSLVIEMYLEPSEQRLDFFKTMLDKLRKKGCNVRRYTKIYEEIKNDYTKSKEQWRY